MRQVDLHVHSTRSDGTYSPTELVDYAIEKGLAAFALTDHDTVSGLDEAISYAAQLRSNGSVEVPEVIPGIEFSTEYQDSPSSRGQDVHIVGLYINMPLPLPRSCRSLSTPAPPATLRCAASYRKQELTLPTRRFWKPFPAQ